MQWTPDRNAGFSTCDPGRLYLPLIMDPLYGYQAVNVEAQLNSTTSLLHWTRRMIEVRKRHPAFGLGEYHELGGSNPSVLAYVRTLRRRRACCASTTCPASRSRWSWTSRRGRAACPHELTGGVPFPPIGELPYLLTLPGHGFYWFSITPAGRTEGRTVHRIDQVDPTGDLRTRNVASGASRRRGGAAVTLVEELVPHLPEWLRSSAGSGRRAARSAPSR